MSYTKNECEIVNRLSRKVEKELAENMTEINERLDNVAEIDDTTSSLTTTYSSDKIEDLINDIPGVNVIDDTTSSLTTTYSSDKINDLIENIPGADVIDDTTSSLTTTYSSNKINDLVDAKTSINDTTSSLTTTYSSDKIDDLVDAKTSINDTTSSLTTTYSSNKINNLVDAKTSINDTTSSLTTTYSSDKIDDLIENIPGADVIDDTVTTTTKTWSSSKIRTEIDAGGGGGSDVIDDVNVTTTTTFSSSKIVDLLFSVLSGESKYIAINTTISRVTGVYTTVLTITDLNLSATSKGVLNLNFSVTAGSSHPGKELLITGIKSDSTTYTINDTLIPRSETSTQAYTLNLPNVEFENNTTQVKIEIKNSTNDQYSATFNFTGYLNTLAI